MSDDGFSVEELNQLNQGYGYWPSQPQNFDQQKGKKKKPNALKSKKLTSMKQQLPPMVASNSQPVLNSFQPLPFVNRELPSSTISGSEAHFLARQFQSDNSTVSGYMADNMAIAAPIVKSKSAGDNERTEIAVHKATEPLKEKLYYLESNIDSLKQTIQKKDMEIDKKEAKIKTLSSEIDQIQKSTSNEMKKLQSEVDHV
jgi:uncharacterized coiled-coil protein SlyX